MQLFEIGEQGEGREGREGGRFPGPGFGDVAGVDEGGEGGGGVRGAVDEEVFGELEVGEVYFAVREG